VSDEIAAGWYPDPDDNGASQRWWDGTDWSETTRPTPAARPRPTPTPAPAPAQYAPQSVATAQRVYQQPMPGPGYPPPDERRKSWPARHKGLLIFSVIAVIIIATIASAASNTKTSPDVNTSPAGPQSGASSAAPVHKTARLGDPISLTGSGNEKVTITVLKVVNPAHATDGFSTPDAGKHFVGVQVRLTNVGAGSYTDAPSNGAKVLDQQDQSYPADIATTTDAGTDFANGQVDLAPGSTEVGVIVFQIPDGATVSKVQMSLDSGFSQTGEWQVG
jgi:hypothetical protein